MCREDAKGMVKAPSPDAEKVRRRKLAKELRSKLAAGDMRGVARLFITTRQPAVTSVDEDCPDCLRLTRGIVPLHTFAVPS